MRKTSYYVSTVWLVEIPLAFSLANLTSLGEFGVPWAIVIGMSLLLLAFLLYYAKGEWLKTGMI